MSQSESEQSTGTPDNAYNLISVIYHTLSAAEEYEQYIEDAEDEDDQELATFLRETQSAAAETAQKAQALLKSRLP